MSTRPSSRGALRALTLAAFSVFALASVPHASAQERVLDIDFNPMVFEDGALVSGTAGTTGAVYRFDTVRLVDGTTIRAFVELEEVTSTCDITLFDDDGSNVGRFQPRLEADGGEGYVDFLIRFVDQDDDTPVALENFAITGVDIDGTSSYQEFHEVGGFSSYVVDASTQLTIGPGDDGRIRFNGRTSNLSGLSFDDSAAYIAYLARPVTEFTFRLGLTDDSSGERFFSINFGTPVGTFSNPVTETAPDVTLSTSAANSTGTFEVTATFDEDVTGFVAADVDVTGGTVDAGSFTAVSGSVYTFDVVPDADASVSLFVPASAAESATNLIASTISNTLELDPMDTAIDSGPASLTRDATGDFVFSSTNGGVSFECSIDGGAFAACASTYATPALGDGPHTLEVRAVDAAGDRDPSPASYAWTVDTTPPDTFITSGPSDPTNDPTGDFVFSTDSGTSYECSVDGAAYAPCPDNFTTADLPDGDHTLDVRAIDDAGNVDPTPATYNWTVDTTPPDTFITSGPSDPTNDPTGDFVFSTDSGTSYECSVDGAAYAPCPDNFTTADLPDGDHTLDVRAIDEAGNVDPTPATYNWTVDTTPPDTFITSGPSDPTNDPTGDFVFSTDSGTSYECSVDGAAYAPCPDNFTTADLPDGDHTLDVRAIDDAGNVDPTPATYSWTVDTTPPDTFITSGPSDPTSDPTGDFVFSTDSGTSYECSVDGAAYAPCPDNFTTTDLPDGDHTLDVRAIDDAGNVDPTPATYSWTVDTTPPDTFITSGPPTRRTTPQATSSSAQTQAHPTSAASTARPMPPARTTSPPPTSPTETTRSTCEPSTTPETSTPTPGDLRLDRRHHPARHLHHIGPQRPDERPHRRLRLQHRLRHLLRVQRRRRSLRAMPGELHHRRPPRRRPHARRARHR